MNFLGKFGVPKLFVEGSFLIPEGLLKRAKHRSYLRPNLEVQSSVQAQIVDVFRPESRRSNCLKRKTAPLEKYH